MHKYKYMLFSKICDDILGYICREDIADENFVFTDSDGKSVVTDMVAFLDGLRAFETYFYLKFKESDNNASSNS